METIGEQEVCVGVRWGLGDTAENWRHSCHREQRRGAGLNGVKRSKDIGHGKLGAIISTPYGRV